MTSRATCSNDRVLVLLSHRIRIWLCVKYKVYQKMWILKKAWQLSCTVITGNFWFKVNGHLQFRKNIVDHFQNCLKIHVISCLHSINLSLEEWMMKSRKDGSDFWVHGRNIQMKPLQQYKSTFTWYCLFFKIFENEIRNVVEFWSLVFVQVFKGNSRAFNKILSLQQYQIDLRKFFYYYFCQKKRSQPRWVKNPMLLVGCLC